VSPRTREVVSALSEMRCWHFQCQIFYHATECFRLECCLKNFVIVLWFAVLSLLLWLLCWQ